MEALTVIAIQNWVVVWLWFVGAVNTYKLIEAWEYIDEVELDWLFRFLICTFWFLMPIISAIQSAFSKRREDDSSGD